MNNWISVEEKLPQERIRVLVSDRRLNYIIGDCFYGACGPVTGKKWDDYFKNYRPITRPYEKCWRYSQTEEPVETDCSKVTDWMELPKGPK